MSLESLLIILLIGALIGWLAGFILKGSGFGLLGNIAIGIVGSLLGSWLLPKLGVSTGSGLGATILVGLVGALILLLIVGLFRGLFWRGPR